MKLRSILGVGSLWACFVAPALAHPGHGTTPAKGLSHWLLEPLHAAPLVAVMIAIAFWLAWRAVQAPAKS
jgi:hydrogenase/urease accessory protein HupE